MDKDQKLGKEEPKDHRGSNSRRLEDFSPGHQVILDAAIPAILEPQKHILIQHLSAELSIDIQNIKQNLAINGSLPSRPSKTKNGPYRAARRRSSHAAWLGNDSDPMGDVDRGYAFVILIVMFIINASTYGTARAYGFIFDKSARDQGMSRSEAAIPFTIMGAFENMSGPLAGYLLGRTRSWRFTVLTGSIFVTMAHSLAAIFDDLIGRIITMGFICGFGMSLITISAFEINNAYFLRYRSRAFGFCLTGAAFGTLYISPICHYMLNEYSIESCYLMLSLILLPNVPLSLLLKPKNQEERKRNNIANDKCSSKSQLDQPEDALGHELSRGPDLGSKITLQQSIKLVLLTPMFHLIWPTQLLFFWFNFVFGMIIVDFGEDRNLSNEELTNLVPTWAFGQLVGRLVLGAIVDMNIISCKLFTVISLGSIGLSTWALNHIHLNQEGEGIVVIVLLFILSAFIANLYILFNSLVSEYIEQKELVAMSIGIASFLGSFFLLPRAHIIGYYRDTEGNYNSMLDLFSYVAAIGALPWLLVSLIPQKKSPDLAETGS